MKFYFVLMAGFLAFSSSLFAEVKPQRPKTKDTVGGISSPTAVLLYSDNSTMITDFSMLPDSVQEQIRTIQSKKKYGSHDLTSSLNEILKHLKLDHPVAVAEGQISKDFKYTKATFQFHKDDKSKGDCHNYPNAFLEMTATKAYQNKGTMVVSADAKVYTTQDKVPAKVFAAAQSVAKKFVSSDGPSLSFDFAVEDPKSGSILVLLMEPAMGVYEYVIKCSKDAQCSYQTSIVGLPCGS